MLGAEAYPFFFSTKWLISAQLWLCGNSMSWTGDTALLFILHSQYFLFVLAGILCLCWLSECAVPTVRVCSQRAVIPDRVHWCHSVINLISAKVWPAKLQPAEARSLEDLWNRHAVCWSKSSAGSSRSPWSQKVKPKWVWFVAAVCSIYHFWLANKMRGSVKRLTSAELFCTFAIEQFQLILI